MKAFGVRFGTFIKIGLIAMVFIVAAKWLFNKVKVPGLSAAVNAV